MNIQAQDLVLAATRWSRHVSIGATLIISGLLAGCREGILAQHGPIAASEVQLLNEATIAMLLVVIPVISLALLVAWWFRASNKRAVYRPQWSYSGKIEFTVWMIPLLIVLFLATLAWVGAHDDDPYKPYRTAESNAAPLNVEVVSLDWRWLFIYPDLGVASLNELVVPANRPIDLRLTSATVMNSFFVPGWAGQIYTMPNMQTRISFLVSDVGESQGFSAHFSGDGFSDMHFKAKSTSNAEFDSWLASIRTSGTTLGHSEYDALARQQQTSGIAYFSNVDPALFDYAVVRAATPSPFGKAPPNPASTRDAHLLAPLRPAGN